ncbi:ABC transporter ATP-binding protein [candidate division KSB1 bacterium]|nr:MAG: ABC transporter ATP-binding protein [candidate division KSB1 bacterium]
MSELNGKAVIAARDLYKIYRMGDVEVRALDGLTLRIEPGEFVAIMGASGSGKSTLMNILGCLDRPTSGQYVLNGEDVSTLSRNQLAGVRNRYIGFVFQGFNLLSRTSAIENVELPLIYSDTTTKERHKLARESLERVGLADRMDHYPSQLSGGQQQRVAIARALVNQPKLLLADEPTGNLDTKTSLEIIELFHSLNREGMTIVLITHEPDIGEHALRRITLRDGRIVHEEKTS